MKTVVSLNGLPVSIFQEGKSFVAYSYAMDLSTSGKNIKQARRRFSEAMQMMIEELVKTKKLDSFLKSQGWTKARKEWDAPRLISPEIEAVAVTV